MNQAEISSHTASLALADSTSMCYMVGHHVPPIAATRRDIYGHPPPGGTTIIYRRVVLMKQPF